MSIYPHSVVHLVEDDDSARDATARFLRAAGHDVRTYNTAAEFLSAPARTRGCVVLDLRLPGLSGLDLQDALLKGDEPLPIVFLTGQGDIPDSVKAMKSGAVDFLTKSVDGTVLLEAVDRALAKDATDHAHRARLRELRTRFERLTPREQELMAHLISGQLNKQMAYDLGITERTVKVHRSRVLEKMEANSVADLVRMARELGIEPCGQV